MNSPELTLYYDSKCPFCAREMKRLQGWDKGGRLTFVDIAGAGFDSTALGVDMESLNRELHARMTDGTILVGIDSMLAAYTLAGKGWLVLPLRVAALRPLLATLYRGFARNRYRFSRWMGIEPAPQCDGTSCRIGNPFLNQGHAHPSADHE